MSLNEGLSFGLSSQHLFIRLNKCAGHLSGISFRYPWRTLLSVSFIGWSRKVNQQILTHLRRGLFKTLSNIYDEVLLLKWLTFYSLTVWYVRAVPRRIFIPLNWYMYRYHKKNSGYGNVGVLNTPLY